MGQYIEIHRSSPGCFNVAEVQAYSSEGGANIIKSSMSVNTIGGHSGYPGTNLIDNNMGTIFHNDCGATPTATINLGSVQPIFKVVIKNRADCCHQRMNGTVLRILDSNKNIIYQSNLITDRAGKTTFQETSADQISTDGSRFYKSFTFYPPNPEFIGSSS
jgi:hypothetical protein